MGLGLAFRAFIKAFKDPQQAQQFVEGEQPAAPKQIEAKDPSHLRLLAYLQQTGRFIDFLKEDLNGLNDAQIGAAVRKIHQDCAQAVEELVTIRPLREEAEGMRVTIPKGYHPSEVKVVGHVKGEPPFSGILVHRGWKAHKRSLPKQTGEHLDDVIAPAEVEVR